jgi:hypothetical protein
MWGHFDSSRRIDGVGDDKKQGKRYDCVSNGKMPGLLVTVQLASFDQKVHGFLIALLEISGKA